MNDFELLVIGAGPGGYTAALRAAKRGLKAGVIEARETGGTCVNRGCVSTKTLLHSSRLYRDALSGDACGVHFGEPQLCLPEVFDNKRRVADTLSRGVESMLKAAKVPLLRGRATVIAPGRVRVCGPEGTAEYCADRILLATGAAPLLPPIPGMDLPGVLTSESLLEGIDTLPSSLLILGGGVIGVEFACFFSDLGVPVTILEGLDRLLPMLDRELGQNLALILKKRNVRVIPNALAERVEPCEGGLRLHYFSRGKKEFAEGEKLLCAVGRRACFDGLFAEGLLPETADGILKVNERFETSIPGLYAIGDAASRMQLAHMAAAQGEQCVDRICGGEVGTDLNLVPSCVYCSPEIAVVGLCEAEAKAAGIPVKVGKCVLGGNARVVISEPGRCFMKVVAHGESGVLLGAQLMCPNAADMISQLSQAIANRLTPGELLRAVRPHPSYEESLGDALRDLQAKLSR